MLQIYTHKNQKLQTKNIKELKTLNLYIYKIYKTIKLEIGQYLIHTNLTNTQCNV